MQGDDFEFCQNLRRLRRSDKCCMAEYVRCQLKCVFLYVSDTVVKAFYLTSKIRLDHLQVFMQSFRDATMSTAHVQVPEVVSGVAQVPSQVCQHSCVFVTVLK